jgi:flagellar hook protein FlgE
MNTQGTVTFTGEPTDAAINGNGFFVVSTEDGGLGFTRSGKFEFNKDGYFVSADGYRVMGYMAVDGEIDTSGELTPIEVRLGQSIRAKATDEMSLSMNLDALAADDSTFTASVQVYDSLGAPHVVALTFTKTGTGTWSWDAALAGEEGTLNASGDLEFDNEGSMALPTDNPTLNITGLFDGAADMEITLNLWDSAGNSLITGFASASAVSSTTQNGFAASLLKEISINSDGVIMGLTDHGQTVPIAQLALADFLNVDGLRKYQGSTFVEFANSGEPSIGVARTGGRGSIVGSSLEQSNVDMAQEFINLIVAQRAYQANSRVIMTTDEMIQDVLNMKR